MTWKHLAVLAIVVTAAQVAWGTTVTVPVASEDDTITCEGGVFGGSVFTYPPPFHSCYNGFTDIEPNKSKNLNNSFGLENGFIRFPTGASLPANAVIDSEVIAFFTENCTNVDSTNITMEFYPDWSTLGASDFTASCGSNALNTPLTAVLSPLNAGGCAFNGGIFENDFSLSNADANTAKGSGNTAFRVCISGGQPTGQNLVDFRDYDIGNSDNTLPQLIIDYHLGNSPTPGSPTRTPADTMTATATPTITPTPTATNTVTCFDPPSSVIVWDLQKQAGGVGLNTLTVNVPHDVPIGHALVLQFSTFEANDLFNNPVNASDTRNNGWYCHGVPSEQNPLISGTPSPNNTSQAVFFCRTTITSALQTGDTISITLNDLFPTTHVVAVYEPVIASGGFGPSAGVGCLVSLREANPCCDFSDCNVACVLKGGGCEGDQSVASGNGSVVPNPDLGNGTASFAHWPFAAELFCATHDPTCPAGWPLQNPTPPRVISSCDAVHCLDVNDAHVQFYDPAMCTCSQLGTGPPFCTDPAWKLDTFMLAMNDSSTSDINFLHPTGDAGCSIGDGGACNPLSPRPSDAPGVGGICTGDDASFTCDPSFPFYVAIGESGVLWDTTARDGDSSHDVVARSRLATGQESQRVGFSLPFESGVQWTMRWDYFFSSLVGTPAPTDTPGGSPSPTPANTRTPVPIFLTPTPTMSPTPTFVCVPFSPTPFIPPTPTSTPLGICEFGCPITLITGQVSDVMGTVAANRRITIEVVREQFIPPNCLIHISARTLFTDANGFTSPGLQGISGSTVHITIEGDGWPIEAVLPPPPSVKYADLILTGHRLQP